MSSQLPFVMLLGVWGGNNAHLQAEDSQTCLAKHKGFRGKQTVKIEETDYGRQSSCSLEGTVVGGYCSQTLASDASLSLRADGQCSSGSPVCARGDWHCEASKSSHVTSLSVWPPASFVCSSVCLSVHLFVSLPICLSIHLSICFPVSLSVCPFVCRSAHVSCPLYLPPLVSHDESIPRTRSQRINMNPCTRPGRSHHKPPANTDTKSTRIPSNQRHISIFSILAQMTFQCNVILISNHKTTNCSMARNFLQELPMLL